MVFSYEVQIQSFLIYLLFHVASSHQLEKSTLYGEYGEYGGIEETNATANSWASLPPKLLWDLIVRFGFPDGLWFVIQYSWILLVMVMAR